MKKFVTWGGASVLGVVGAAAAFFLDPKKGSGRRHAAVEKGSTIVRRERAHVSTMVAGAAKTKPGKGEKKPSAKKPSTRDVDDAIAVAVRGALENSDAQLVETVGVRVVRGRVTLRGEVAEIDLIGTVARKVSDIDGVREVNNLLRLGATS